MKILTVTLTLLFYSFNATARESDPLSRAIAALTQHKDDMLRDGIDTRLALPSPSNINPIIQRAIEGYWFDLGGDGKSNLQRMKLYGIADMRLATIDKHRYFVVLIESDLGAKILAVTNDRGSKPDLWWYQFFDYDKLAEQDAAANP